MLGKFDFDPSHVLTYNPLELREDLTHKEKLGKILAHEDKILERKNIAFMKLMWRNHSAKEATLERKEESRVKYLNSLTLGRKCASN